MQYGSTKELSSNMLCVYMGANSNKQNYVLKSDHISIMPMLTSLQAINQRDASILYLQKKVGIYKQHCGSLSRYGIKHMRAFANMCNAGVGKEQMAQASTNACT
ncbi:hypothetical protein Ancab_002045 [Ancistrocladus abbreviatus]